MATNVWHLRGLDQELINQAKASALTRRPKRVTYAAWVNEAITEKLKTERLGSES